MHWLRCWRPILRESFHEPQPMEVHRWPVIEAEAAKFRTEVCWWLLPLPVPVRRREAVLPFLALEVEKVLDNGASFLQFCVCTYLCLKALLLPTMAREMDKSKSSFICMRAVLPRPCIRSQSRSRFCIRNLAKPSQF